MTPFVPWRVDRPWASLHRFKSDWRLLAIILVADLAGMLFGWYYYWDVGQFDPSSRYYVHWAWWPLVADSPNAVLLFFVAVLAYRLTGWRNKVLDSTAFVLNIYVGLWTTFLFLSYPERMGTWDWGGTNNILFWAHFGMPLQSVILVHDMRRDRLGWTLVAALTAFFALFVWVDYWGPHLHPAPFLHGGTGDATLHSGAPWLMIVAMVAWLAVVLPGTLRRRPASMDPHATTVP